MPLTSSDCGEANELELTRKLIRCRVDGALITTTEPDSGAVAIGGKESLFGHDVRVPVDVSIIGCDDVDFS